jgi:predicted ATPase
VPGTGNLPAELTGFVGRKVELTIVLRMLRRAQLVTVVGAGGVGKSRLALRAAAAARTDFADGAWLVPCAELTDPALLCHAIAEALRLTDGTARPAREVLRDFLAPRRLLLVLDGCEHLVAEAAPLLASLLSAAPG